MGDFILRKDIIDRVHTSQAIRSNLIEANKIIGPISGNSSGIVIINGSTVIVNSSTTCINASGQFKVIASNILEVANIVTINSSTTCINASGLCKIIASAVVVNSSSIVINSSVVVVNANTAVLNSSGVFINASTVLVNADTTINGSLIVTGPFSALNISSNLYNPTLTLNGVTAWSLVGSFAEGYFIRYGNMVAVAVRIVLSGTFAFGAGKNYTVSGTLPIASTAIPNKAAGVTTLRPNDSTMISSDIPFGSGDVLVQAPMNKFTAQPYVGFLTTGTTAIPYDMACTFIYSLI